MSWRIFHQGPGKDVDGRHEQLADLEKPLRSPLEQTQIEATKPLVDALTKHARHGDHSVDVEAQGHLDENGHGGMHVTVQVYPTPAAE